MAAMSEDSEAGSASATGGGALALDRGLARLRLRPTRHARRPLLTRASRAPSTCRSLVP